MRVMMAGWYSSTLLTMGIWMACARRKPIGAPAINAPKRMKSRARPRRFGRGGTLSSVTVSEATIDERRVERGEKDQHDHGRGQQKTDECVLQELFHLPTPNINASMCSACCSGSMNGTQPMVTQTKVRTTPAACTARD